MALCHPAAVGKQFIEPVLVPSRGEPSQHIGQVGQRRHAVLGGAAHEAVDRRAPPGGVVRARPRHGGRCSSSSRGGTILTGVIRRWADLAGCHYGSREPQGPGGGGVRLVAAWRWQPSHPPLNVDSRLAARWVFVLPRWRGGPKSELSTKTGTTSHSFR